MTERSWFFVKECPLKECCSTQAWKRAACWADSYDGAIERCARHLRVSSSNALSDEEAAILSAEGEADHRFWQERMAWFTFYEELRISVEHGTILVFG